MNIALLIVLSLLVSTAFAGVYKWTDQEGRVHYSDRPVTGAEVQELALPTSGRKTKPTPADQDSGLSVYEELEIVSPEEGQTIRSDSGSVRLGMIIRPPLNKDHRLQILIDGAPVPGVTGAAQFSLNGISYGSHRLQATIIDYQDQPIASSAVVNFHLRKPLPPTATVE